MMSYIIYQDKTVKELWQKNVFVFVISDAEFLLCEDGLTETNSLSDIVQFILSDYANEG